MSDEIVYREFMSSEIRDVDDKERSFSHPISDETPDGHGSIIRVDGWDLKRFKSNPVVLFPTYSLSLPIDSSDEDLERGRTIDDEDTIRGLDQLHPFAETSL